MSPTVKSSFGILARELRVKNGLKQREVAEKIGIKLSTYGNLESSRWKVIRREKAQKLCEVYNLNEIDSANVMAQWELCPLSPDGEKNKAHWERKNRLRSKANNHDRLAASLVEVCSLLLESGDEAELCNCGFDGKTEADPTRSCELCTAFEALGLPAFTTRDAAIESLAKAAQKLEAKT